MMWTSLVEKTLARIDEVRELYYRLILVVGPSGSGKTAVLREVADRTGARLSNVNREIAAKLLEFTTRRRALLVANVLEEVVGPDQPLAVLDNTEILFDVTLEQDPLRLLQGLSRNRTVVASWNGTVDGGHLVYAAPEHPEHRRYPVRGLTIVSVEAAE